jgi:D-aminopeptidase
MQRRPDVRNDEHVLHSVSERHAEKSFNCCESSHPGKGVGYGNHLFRPHPGATWEARINGNVVGESAINALVAAHYHVPIIFISGGAVTIGEAQTIAPVAEKVIVKHSLGRFAAAHIHHSVA